MRLSKKKMSEGFLLGITKEMYENELLTFAEGLSRIYGIRVRLSEGYGPAYTESDSHTGRVSYIVMKTKLSSEEMHVVRSLFGKEQIYVSDNAYLDHMTAFYHERRHCEQSFLLCQRNDQLGRDLACAAIARNGNPDFYKEHYPAFATEADAECTALREMRRYLHDTFELSGLSSEKLDEIMLGFVNEKCKDPNYLLCQFGRGPYENMSDFIADLDTAYEKSQFGDVKDVAPYARYLEDSSSKDKMIAVLQYRKDLAGQIDVSGFRIKCQIMTGITKHVEPALYHRFSQFEPDDYSMISVCGSPELKRGEILKMQDALKEWKLRSEDDESKCEHL